MSTIQLRVFLFLSFALWANNTLAETLIEKQKNMRDLTAIELTAIYMAEIRWCEDRVPDFKKQAGDLLTRFKNNPKYIEISRSPTFDKLAPEANEFVLARRRGADIKNTCDRELLNLRNQKF